jgi:hypothetical protein
VTGAIATKTAAKTTAGSAKLGYRAGRLVGYRRVVMVLVGVGIGLLVAPMPGRQLRGRIRERIETQFIAASPAVPPTMSGASSSNGQHAWRPEPAPEEEILEEPGTNPAP